MPVFSTAFLTALLLQKHPVQLIQESTVPPGVEAANPQVGKAATNRNPHGTCSKCGTHILNIALATMAAFNYILLRALAAVLSCEQQLG
jgi:hypothetical protein